MSTLSPVTAIVPVPPASVTPRPVAKVPVASRPAPSAMVTAPLAAPRLSLLDTDTVPA
ncbi:hypothetical protein [Rhodoligotrophos defluvii]|uniref:hypothetical protein n=1 Tax=Rhodoligotrophos defluvii TaxID=2561934 RepID=UPI001EF10762|nr:hypothetical protein [Rhodoligotrophos defluvii]